MGQEPEEVLLSRCRFSAKGQGCTPGRGEREIAAPPAAIDMFPLFERPQLKSDREAPGNDDA